ncbi:MAG TPA: Rieske 2Fe-2S domain-containing protein [Rhizomicrobium sp.]|jgi:phenylpropionate dioxygenase-like ring-hydroxylating dioxygenase large terminal subunit|nr:Rieske 2Fe-2S domain-containing protein [Rhizomicrobium sp.]
MLTEANNEMITRTGPGTPMGELFRRFWLPAVTSAELEKDGSPVRLRIMSEDLVAFRDSNGKVGIIEAYCSHRLAPLFFGRNEECGLRCPYHGWKFDVNGKCVEMPNTAKGDSENVRERVALKSYPTQEAGGLIWLYMGPKERQPAFPKLESTQVPDKHRHVSRWLQRSNWLAGLEGELDTSHISWLHKHFDQETNPVKGGGSEFASDGSPELTVRETDYGLLYGARRQSPKGYFWRVTQWLVPMFSLIPRLPGTFTAGGGRAWVPVDDNNVTTFHFYYRIDAPLSAEDDKLLASGVAFPPRLKKGSVRIDGRSPIDTFLPVANIENDYLMDREHQKKVNFTGIYGANEQDRALQESMRMVEGSGIVDRAHEHLMGSDLAVATMRRRLTAMAKAMAEGREPEEPHKSDLFAARAISKVCDIGDFDKLRETYRTELSAPQRQAELMAAK